MVSCVAVVNKPSHDVFQAGLTLEETASPPPKKKCNVYTQNHSIFFQDNLCQFFLLFSVKAFFAIFINQSKMNSIKLIVKKLTLY